MHQNKIINLQYWKGLPLLHLPPQLRVDWEERLLVVLQAVIFSRN